MLRRTLAVLPVLLLTLAADAPPKSAGLMDGGIAAWDKIDAHWKYENGTITGSTDPDGLKFNTFLVSPKEYKNFELTFLVKLRDGKGNSGVQIRSKVIDPKTKQMEGPQADMAEGYWGSLYGEHFGGMMKAAPKDKIKEAVKPKEFNRYAIKCVGQHVTITLNGTVMVDDDFPKMPASGKIGWQVHQGPAMEVTFKEIVFKELP